MTDLIGLSGYAQAGKDTVAALLAKHGFQRVAFADALRQVALDSDPLIDCTLDQPAGERGSFRTARLSQLVQLSGWDAVKVEYADVRQYLQRLGCAMRDQQPGIWVQIAMRRATDILQAGGRVVVTDVRFPDEAEAIRTRTVRPFYAYGGKMWRIERPGCGPVNGHVSETALDGYDFDLILGNNGTIEDLQQLVDAAAGISARIMP